VEQSEQTEQAEQTLKGGEHGNAAQLYFAKSSDQEAPGIVRQVI
jgi:hypothetical protein